MDVADIVGGTPRCLQATAVVAAYLVGGRLGDQQTASERYAQIYEGAAQAWNTHQEEATTLKDLAERFPPERIIEELDALEDGVHYASTLPTVAAAIDADIESEYFGGDIKEIMAEVGAQEPLMLLFSRTHARQFLTLLGRNMDLLSIAISMNRYGNLTPAPGAKTVKDQGDQPATFSLLQRVRTERFLSSSRNASPDINEIIIGRLIEVYNTWQQEMSLTTPPDLKKLGFLPVRKLVDTPEELPAGPSAEEIAALTADFDAAANRYDSVTQRYRSTSRQLDKEGFRPATTSILREIRDTTSTLSTLEAEDGQFTKRIVGTLRQLARLGAAPRETLHETVHTLVPTERAAYETLLDASTALTSVGEQTNLPPSLDTDLRWIEQHWDQLKPHIEKHWPKGTGKQTGTAISAFLKEFHAVRTTHEQDPRQKLYAIARHVGRAALPPQTREQTTAHRRAPVFRIERANAEQGLETILAQSKDLNVRQRAGVITHFMKEAHQTADSTGADQYGLYFADSAKDVRDRYFIIRIKDSDDRDWFILETLEAERATYLIPVEVLRQLDDSIKTPEQELEAALEHNKATTRELGELVSLRNQIVHIKDWTAASHVANIKRRITAYDGV